MADIHRTDLLVIGAGTGGYSAAFRAADLGLDVTLVEADDRLGGTCLLRGCIPSKALLHAAALISNSRDAKELGITFSKPKVDIDELRKWKDGVVSRLSGGLDGLAKRRNVHRLVGRALFQSSRRVELNGGASHVEFKNAIIATGSRPTSIPLFDIGSDRVLDSTSALTLEQVPKSLLVIGGGYIGLELGTVYAELGSKVTVVEMLDGLLAGTDRDLVKPLHARLEKIFAGIHLKSKVTAIEESGEGLAVTFDGEIEKKKQTFERILVSVGRSPNSERLGLENTGVELDAKGFILIDTQQRTGDDAIMAVGDVAGGVGLAHKAAHEGKIAAEVLAGQPAAFDAIVPAVVFTDPELAWCGLTETEAKAENISIETTRFPWTASGRAIALNRTDGVTKLVIEPETQRVLGVGIAGHGAGELIAEGVVSVEMGAVAEDLAGSIHPHPTLSESIGIAAEIYLGTATDLYMPKKK